MILRLVTAPTAEPVSLTETKLHLRVDVTADDALIERLITTAREYCEMVTRRALVTQTLEYYLDDWDNPIVLNGPTLIGAYSTGFRSERVDRCHDGLRPTRCQTRTSAVRWRLGPTRLMLTG